MASCSGWWWAQALLCGERWPRGLQCEPASSRRVERTHPGAWGTPERRFVLETYDNLYLLPKCIFIVSLLTFQSFSQVPNFTVVSNWEDSSSYSSIIYLYVIIIIIIIIITTTTTIIIIIITTVKHHYENLDFFKFV